MARERMVTRTVEVKQVNVLTLNVETMKAEKMIVPITGKPDDKKLEKLVKAAVETESVKFVQILGIETSEVLYGMTEADFIRLAKVLPPRSGATESEDEG